MIFVLLAYGGWNEAAYLAGEVRDARRNMTRILVWGVIAVTALYLVVNLGYLAVLGHGGIRESKAVAATVRALADLSSGSGATTNEEVWRGRIDTTRLVIADDKASAAEVAAVFEPGMYWNPVVGL